MKVRPRQAMTSARMDESASACCTAASNPARTLESMALTGGRSTMATPTLSCRSKWTLMLDLTSGTYSGQGLDLLQCVDERRELHGLEQGLESVFVLGDAILDLAEHLLAGRGEVQLLFAPIDFGTLADDQPTI